MPNYEKSSIYKLCCKNVDVKEIYIGSTTNFKRRKNAHKTICNNENHNSYNVNVYQYIRNNGGWANFDMIEIKKVNCIDRRELCKIEREFIEKYNSKLNQALPYITEEEKKTYKKNYDETNKEKIKQRVKNYYINNKEQVLKSTAEYREKNKEQINERRRQKINCDCGSIVNKSVIARHNTTSKHKTFEESKIILKN